MSSKQKIFLCEANLIFNSTKNIQKYIFEIDMYSVQNVHHKLLIIIKTTKNIEII